MYCTRLTKNTGRKNSPSAHHRIQYPYSPTAENRPGKKERRRRRKKKKVTQLQNIISASATQSGHNKQLTVRPAHECMHITAQLVLNAALNSSDNLPSYPPDTRYPSYTKSAASSPCSTKLDHFVTSAVNLATLPALFLPREVML